MELTVGKVAGYTVGSVLILFGLLWLLIGPLGGLLIIAVGAFSLPIVRTKIADRFDVNVSRGLVIGIVVFGAMAGLVIGAYSPIGDGSSTNPDEQTDVKSPEPELISKPESDLVLTVGDFGSGWQGSQEGNRSTLFNTQTEAIIECEAAVFDSVPEAREEYQNRVDEVEELGYGYDSVSIGDEAILYTPAQGWGAVIFREQNAIGVLRVGEVLTPETNAVNHARKMHEKYV